MIRYNTYIIFAILLISKLLYADMHDDPTQDANSINDIAPLEVRCTEDEAVLANSIDCDRNRFLPDCVKISLSENPVINWTSFDFVRHAVVILKEGVPFDERAVGFDMSFEERERFPATWWFNFKTGEFIGRDNNQLRNVQAPDVSLVNTGEGVYNIWCRYHFAVGMVMKLIVTP